jgi:hypothetical protein
MHRLSDLVVDVSKEFELAGLADAGAILQKDLQERRLADKQNLQMLMQAALLHPRKDLDTMLDGMDEAFHTEAAKANLPAMTATGTIGETQVRRGERAVAVVASEYDSWRDASATVNCPHGVVAYWIEQASFPRVRAIAMKFAAFNSSSADVERLFAGTRAGFDHNQASILTTHLSTRMCTKINGRMLKRFGLEE